MDKNYSLKGLTLVELMIVIAIIGILAALVILSFNLQIFKGNDSKRKNDLDRIRIAIEEYEKDHNCYPDPVLMNNCGTDETIPIHPYLNDVPCDPVTGQPYAYETDGLTCSRWFRLYSILQNTKDTSVIYGIGPGDLYNYYVSSANAPVVVGTTPTPEPTSSSTPQPTDSGSTIYGCSNGSCIVVPYSNGEPVCQPTYDSSNCYNQCGSLINPANECVSN